MTHTNDSSVDAGALLMEPDRSQTPAFKPWQFWIFIAAFCALISGAGFFASRLTSPLLEEAYSLSKYFRLEGDLEAVERSGESVRLSALQGKVRTIAYLYTVCPHGCAAVIHEMTRLDQSFGTHPDFHQVSVTVAPERDDQKLLALFARGLQLDADARWWFLTGDRQALWDYMTGTVKFMEPTPIPEEERLHPLDTYAHDLRIALVDRAGYVRGFYDVYHADSAIAKQMATNLRRDVSLLLNDPTL